MNSSSNSFNKPLLFAWIIVILSLSLILKSGLYSDDIMCYQMYKSKGSLSFHQMMQTAYADALSGMQGGRFTPLSYFFCDLLFWLSNTILIYKVIIFCINLLAVYSFTRLFRVIEMADWVPFSLLIFTASAQFYVNYHDPFTSLHGMYPLLAILIFTAISSFVQYLKSGKSQLLFIALLATTLSIMNSEIGFIIYPILVSFLIKDSRAFSRKLLLFSSFLVLLVLYAVVFFVIRENTQNVYVGVETNLEFSKMISTFGIQVAATLPLVSFTHIGAIPIFILKEIISTSFWLVLFVVAFFSLFITYRSEILTGISKSLMLPILIMGFVLLLLPPCLLMVSKKYQGILTFGMGYLPVYIQDFGFVLLILLLLEYLLSVFKPYSIVIKNVAFAMFFMISILTFLRNDYVINEVNNNRSIPSIFYYESLKNGILNNCEDGSVIILRTDYFWHAPFFYQIVIDNFYDKKLHVISEEYYNQIKPDEKRPCYLLEHDAVGQFTLLYKVFPDGIKPVRRINYPTGNEFSYFDLISKPL